MKKISFSFMLAILLLLSLNPSLVANNEAQDTIVDGGDRAHTCNTYSPSLNDCVGSTPTNCNCPIYCYEFSQDELNCRKSQGV